MTMSIRLIIAILVFSFMAVVTDTGQQTSGVNPKYQAKFENIIRQIEQGAVKNSKQDQVVQVRLLSIGCTNHSKKLTWANAFQQNHFADKLRLTVNLLRHYFSKNSTVLYLNTISCKKAPSNWA